MDPIANPQQPEFLWRRFLDTPPAWSVWLPACFALIVVYLLAMFRQEKKSWRMALFPLFVIIGLLAGFGRDPLKAFTSFQGFAESQPDWSVWLPACFAVSALYLLGNFLFDPSLRRMAVPAVIVSALGAGYAVAGLRVFLGLFSWWYLLVPILGMALLYVGLMYLKDSRSVHPAVAAFLGFLRCCVYAILAAVFLLPGCQTFDMTEYHSKVLMLFDVSGSMVSTIDDLPEIGQDPAKLPTRQDKVLRALHVGKDGKPLLGQILGKTPVTAYRHGTALDESEIQAWKDQGPDLDSLTTWLKPDKKNVRFPENMKDDDKEKLRAKYYDLVDSLLSGTNIGGSALQMAKLEANSFLQAVVIFSDGQSNLGSDDALREFVNRLSGGAKKGVPIFTVGVGEYRLPASIRIDDLQAPETARPDDKFPVRVPVVGSGLGDEEFTVTLEVTRVKDATGQPTKGETTHVLGPQKGKFQGAGDYPQDTVEFEIDVQDLKKISAQDDKDGLLEGTWQFVAKVPRHPREAFAAPEHVTDPPVDVLVQKRKQRVLLFAGGPTREYQFLRTLLYREVLEKRLELSVLLQTGREDHVDQDVEAERFLSTFPNKLGPTEPNEKYMSLSDYDVIIAIDPDWLALDTNQMKLLKEWVGTHSGGIVFVAGPVHSYQLARPAGVDITPLKTLLPVHLSDSRLHGLGGIGHDTSRPYVLNFTPSAKLYDFLKLDDTQESPVAGWDRFFWAGTKPADPRTEKPRRGIYNYYPVDKIKADSSVIATFAGPESSRINDGKDEQPFIVSMRFGNGKTMYLGSAETWRLKHAKDLFYERFWIKLTRYMSAGATQQKKYGRILLARTVPVGAVPFEAQIKGKDLLPLSPDLRPTVTVKRLDAQEGPKRKDEHFDLKPKQTSGDWAGWFAGTFRVKEPGEYEFRIPIPGTNESLTQRLTVRKPNPELDNVRNNFGLLYQLASEAKDHLNSLPAETRRKMQRLLQPLTFEDAKQEGKEVPRLFFKLENADAIADCLVTVPPKRDFVKGKLFDLWDKGYESPYTANAYTLSLITPLVVGALGMAVLLFFGQYLFAGLFLGAGVLLSLIAVIYDKLASPAWPDLPLSMSYVLVVVVTLLGVEWLTRKLLKLA